MKTVNIGDTDRNADWILTPEQREEEMAIHDELARQHKREALKKAVMDLFKRDRD